MRLPNAERERPAPAGNTRQPRWLWLAGGGLLLLALVLWLRQPVGERPSSPTDGDARQLAPPQTDAELLRRGRELALQACQGCHLLPNPADLDKFSWSAFALPLMAKWLGVTPADWTAAPGGDLVEKARVTPDTPVLDHHQWHAAASYYLENAPLRPLPQTNKPPLKIGLDRFEVVFPEHRQERPMTTLAKISSRAPGFYLHDAETKRFQFLTPLGQVRASIEIEGPVVDVIESPGGLFLTVIGDILPSHLRNGRIDFLPFPGQANPEPRRMILRELPRPTNVQPADLDGDGDEDMVVCSFGNVLGRFSWFERLADGQFEEHVLFERPGAVRAEVRDFDRDGRPDIMVLMAQAREGIYLLWNRGGGTFEVHIVVEQIPSWGYAYFELADFNGDGHPDILAVNGDNGDAAQFHHPGALKNYHGLRIYLNDGANRFAEKWFYPMYGAYKARAVDFDQDGDLDIAAISLFPDYLGEFKESFVYLESQGGLRFAAATFNESISGRWMVMDAGDLDGDGDADIVLGAFNRAFRDVPPLLAKEWALHGPSVLILRNTLRK